MLFTYPERLSIRAEKLSGYFISTCFGPCTLYILLNFHLKKHIYSSLKQIFMKCSKIEFILLGCKLKAVLKCPLTEAKFSNALLKVIF